MARARAARAGCGEHTAWGCWGRHAPERAAARCGTGSQVAGGRCWAMLGRHQLRGGPRGRRSRHMGHVLARHMGHGLLAPCALGGWLAFETHGSCSAHALPCHAPLARRLSAAPSTLRTTAASCKLRRSRGLPSPSPASASELEATRIAGVGDGVHAPCARRSMATSAPGPCVAPPQPRTRAHAMRRVQSSARPLTRGGVSYGCAGWRPARAMSGRAAAATAAAAMTTTLLRRAAGQVLRRR